MAKLIPNLNDCHSLTSGEQKVAEILKHHLNDSCWVWVNPPIPPENLEPDFIVLDPGRGLIVIEVKDWKLSTVGKASPNSVTLIKPDGNSEAKNPYRQAKTYIHAAIDRLKQQTTLVYPQGHSRQGQLVFPYIPEVILTNISRDELRQKELEEIFGSRSVLCSDEIVKNIASETFVERLWSPRQFSMQTRLTPEQINSICNSLCLEKPLELTKKTIRPIKPSDKKIVVPPSIPEPPEPNARDIPPPTSKLPDMKRKIPVLALGSGLLIALAGLGISLPYFLHPKLEVSSLTIGTLGSPEYQADLADHLKQQFVPNDYWQFLTGKKIKVVIDGDKTLPYQEAERRIENQEWDIAFTLSPVISVAAKDNGYTFAAKMFPNSKGYQSALFVKSDSPIQSIDDIKPSTILALGGASSASSFYMPSYDLYGKSLTVDMGHRGPEILELVKTGRANVGAGAVGDTVKADDPSIRIIHQSRDIPSSGIYLSPKLSASDRQTLRSVLLSAPQDIQKKANYGAGEEPDYSFFQEIITKAENVQICADFTKNPVNLFCADTYQPITVAGKVNGWSLRANARILNLRESSGKTYRVAVSPQLLAEVIGNSEPIAVQGKQIQVKTSSAPQQLADGSFELKLTQARQLKVLAITGSSATN